MKKVFFLFLLLRSASGWAQQDVSFQVAHIFGDNMVLQQGCRVPVWGTARPGSTVTVRLLNYSATAKADSERKKVSPLMYRTRCPDLYSHASETFGFEYGEGLVL